MKEFTTKETIWLYLVILIETLPISLGAYMGFIILSIFLDSQFIFDKIDIIILIFLVIGVFLEQLYSLKKEIDNEEKDEWVDEINDYIGAINFIAKANGKNKGKLKKFRR